MISTEHLQLVRDAAIANDLGPYVEQIQALVRPSVVLATARAKSAEIATGGTRIGGTPDMPDSLEWPIWKGQPLAFIGQINLAELASFELGLPREGILMFFFCFDSELRTTRPQNSAAGVVYHVQNAKVSPRKPPRSTGERFGKCSVRFIPCPSLPPPYADRIEELWGLGFLKEGDLHDAYGECIHCIEKALGIDKLSTGDGYNYHQLLGYPRPVQYTPIEIQVERARKHPGEDVADESPEPTFRRSLWEAFKDFVLSSKLPILPPAHDVPRSPDDLTHCRDWQSLLMIQEDDNAGIQLIDSGRIYYLYPREQLGREKFDSPWTMLDFG